MRVHVEARHGSGQDAQPIRFDLGGGTIEVTEVLDRWDGEDAVLFRVRGDDEHTYVLRRNQTYGLADSWEMASFTHKDSRGTAPDTAEGTQVLH